MSSPSKMIKLTPRRQFTSSNTNIATQESKVTSTPQRFSGSIASPDISKISSTTSSCRTRLSEIFNNEKENILMDSGSDDESTSTSPPVSTFGSNSEKSRITEVEEYDVYINDIQRIKYTGRIWKLYKPMHDTTLYANIFQNPRNIQEIVTELLLLFNSERENVTCKWLKLCVDVCGFQNFEVALHYNFRDSSISKQVIEIMQSKNVLGQYEVLIKGNYLLMEPASGLAKVLKISIYNFLQKLIITAHERGILYDDYFAEHFFMFVKCMSFSRMRPIRHTGVVFATKILTALVVVYNKILNEGNSDSSAEIDIERRKREINKYLEFFYIIFVKNCRLQDNKLKLMRVECIYESIKWIKYFPKMFISQLTVVTYLLKLIPDPMKEVRLAAVGIFETLVESEDILKLLKIHNPNFTELISGRFYDIDTTVTIKAINIYSTFFKYDESLISPERFKMLLDLVFNRCFLIGEAATKFLLYYLRKKEDNPEIMLLQLAKFSMKPGNYSKQFLVEGCLNNCPIIQNWRLYISILMENEVELYIKQALTELFAEAVYQVLMGRSTVMRDKSRKVVIVDPVEHMNVARYLPMLQSLLEKYHNYTEILIELLKICLTVRDTVLKNVSEEVFEKICRTMEKLFEYHDDEALLEKLCDTFYYFSNLGKESFVQSVINNLLKYSNDLVKKLSDASDETRNAALKVSILFIHFNLSKYLKWEILFEHCSEFDESTTGIILSCCKWYLIWSLRNMKTTKNSLAKIPTLKKACEDFTQKCFTMLSTLKGQPLHFKIYDSLCDFHIAFMIDLRGMIKTVKQMEQLKLRIGNVEHQDILLGFLEKYVIEDATMPKVDRRRYVTKYMNLANINVLPTDNLRYIFKYYYKFKAEYGSLIESSLSDLAGTDENTFLMIIIYTLTTVYENIFKKYNAFAITMEEARDLKLLLKTFLNCKEFKSPKNKYTKLIFFAINYSFTGNLKSRYGFLSFAKYFADLLVDHDEIKQVSLYLKEKIPKSAETNDEIRFLANHIKNLKPGAVSGKPKPALGPKKIKENKTTKKENKTPQKRPSAKASGKKTGTSRRKPTPEKEKKQSTAAEIETDISEDDLTIHDTESDDLDESFTSLRV